MDDTGEEFTEGLVVADQPVIEPKPKPWDDGWD